VVDVSVCDGGAADAILARVRAAVTRRDPRARRLVRVVALAAILPGCGSRTPAYNVLLVSLDTVRQDALGCYGHRSRHAPDVAPTPSLDRLAREGVRMLDAYAPSSWTLPSHVSLLTGEPPLVHGVETEVRTLDPATPTLASLLGARGYRTYGYYSAPYLERHWGFARGFDDYQAVYGPDVVAASARAAQIRDQVGRVAAAGDWRRYDELKRDEVGIDEELTRSSEKAVTSDRVSAAVIERLESLAHERRPWFVFAHYFDAHCDYVPPPPYDTRFDPDYAGTATGAGCLSGAWVGQPDPERPGGFLRTIGDRDLEHVLALYEGEVAWVDYQVGRVLDALDRLDLARRTLVVVVSDHGEAFFEHGSLGHRHDLHEEAVRIPMLLRLPGVLPAGAAVRGPVSLTDVVPTVLDVLGVPHTPPPGGTTSFVPLLHGASAADRTVLLRLVMMFGGDVQVDAGEHVTLREIMVEDGFRQGALKITRTRMWPQFPAGAGADLQLAFATEAANQYAREDLRWIDVDRFPAEPDAERSGDFGDPTARRALDGFRREYAGLLGFRSRRTSPLPENVRARLESLGYVQDPGGAEFPEPDVVLPPPGG
jgi:arylsulfatase A-like enzyme